MRPRSPRARGPPNDEAVSAVIGTILVIGMLITTLVTIQVHYVPAWQRDAASDKAAEVRDEFGGLRADLQRLLDGAPGAAAASVVALGGQDGASFLGIGGAPAQGASLDFTPASAPALQLSAPTMTVFVDEDASDLEAIGLDEAWKGIPGNGTVALVSGVQSFRVRIDELSKDHDGGSFTLRVDDRVGAFVGSLTFYVQKDPPDYNLFVRTCNVFGCPSGSVLYDQGIAFHISNTVYDYTVDALNKEYRFNKLLAAAEEPFSVDVTQAGLSGEYAITYSPWNPPGSVPPGSSGGLTGLVVSPWDATLESGSLALRTTPPGLPPQTLRLENGAYVLEQGDGSVFRAEPGFAVQQVGNLTRLAFRLPQLNGTAASLAGGIATLHATATNQTTFLGRTTNLTMVLGTQYPALWSSYLDRAFDTAGLAAGTHYSLASGAANVTLQVLGQYPLPGQPDQDVELAFQTAKVELQL